MTKAPKFRDFITEAKGDNKYKLLIITDEPEKAKHFILLTDLEKRQRNLGGRIIYTNYLAGIHHMKMASLGYITKMMKRVL